MSLNVIIEKDKDGYFARILEFEGCVSQGNTYEETLRNIKEAGELYLESLRLQNNSLKLLRQQRSNNAQKKNY
ncbi:type II toxin-antitoxin system HicB family antitoxin [Campylobacter coli]|nr:type II toxin-antitoxin system HicB family antitoxin [Campylobacter jejuni]EGD5552749.1 type II toxin-antitoxin system HicB family antitoxin [Campylobacter coli]